MFLFLIVLVSFTLIFSSIRMNGNNEGVIFSRQTSQTINGFFVLLVFISHYIGYFEISGGLNVVAESLILRINQLMVTTFLFFSGYGIMSSLIKEGKYDLIKMSKRLFNMWFNFAVAITIFFIVGNMYGDTVSMKQLGLSYIGWSSLFNSAWYMFMMFCVYIITIASMKISKNDNQLVISIFVFTLFLFYLIARYKMPHWYNTILCYPFGMLIKLNEDKLKQLINSNWSYYFVNVIVLFAISYMFANQQTISYSIYSMLFLTVMTVFCVKFKLSNRILSFISGLTFEIYIYQRLFFRIFISMGIGATGVFLITFASTILFSVIIKQLTNSIRIFK